MESRETIQELTLVPSGAFIMSKSDDLANLQRCANKTVTVRSFIWMTEITNSEYRQFVNWVL
jgi:formylglycine-generating enzyme required for sulfatase activity